METIKFIEERRNQPHNSSWHETEVDHIDLFAIINKEKRHIKGRAIAVEGSLLYGEKEEGTEELEELKQQFIKNNGKWICYYCPSGMLGSKPKQYSPFEFIDFVKKNNYSFNDFFEIYYVQKMNVWKFHGNLNEISYAFSFRIYNKETIDEIKKQCKRIAIVKR